MNVSGIIRVFSIRHKAFFQLALFFYLKKDRLKGMTRVFLLTATTSRFDAYNHDSDLLQVHIAYVF
jgi:hypothetical protein